MDHPAYGIAGMARSRRASLSSTAASSPPEGGQPYRVQVRSPKRHNAGTANVVYVGDRGGAGSGCGEERRVRDVADGRRPPLQAHPVAWRTRSKISSFDVMPQLEARQCRSPADGRPSDLGMGSDGGCTGVVLVHVEFPVASRTRSKLSFFQALPLLESRKGRNPADGRSSDLGVGNDGGRPRQVHKMVHLTIGIAERTRSGCKSSKHREEPGGARDDREERRDTGVADGWRPPLDELPVASRTRSKLSFFQALPPLESRKGRNPADGRSSDLGVGNDGGRPRQVHKMVHLTIGIAERTRSRCKSSKHREEPGGARDDREERRDTVVADGRRPPLDELPVASRTRSKLSFFQALPQTQLPSSRSPGDGGPSDLGVGEDGDCPRFVQTHMMVHPATGIAGRTRSHYKGSRDHEEPGGTRDDGEERRHKTAADGRRPPLYDLPVASRTRSKLSSFLALLQLQLRSGGSPENEGPSGLGDSCGMENRGGRTGSSVWAEPYVHSGIPGKPPFFGAAIEVFDLESSEDEEPTPTLISSIEEGKNVKRRGGGEGEGEMVAGVPVKRKWSCSINVLNPSRGSASPYIEEQGIAKRTRSHFASQCTVEWPKQPSSLRSTYNIADDPDVSEPDLTTHSSSSHSKHQHNRDHDDGSDLSSISVSDSAIKDGVAEVRGSQRWGEFKPSEPRTKRKRGCKPPSATGSIDHCRVLLDDILQKGGEPRETLEQRALPLVFSFGDEDICNSAVEKSEYEQAIDSLWAEFDFAMGVNELGSNCDFVGNGHKLVLDERIGIICEHCSFVELEIRYVPPSLHKTRYCSAKPNNRTWRDEEDVSILRALGEKAGADHDTFDSPMADETKGTIWDLVDPCVKGNLFPHQREGLEFIWRNMAGDILIEKVKNSVASDAVLGGCVITHAPGTGKTRLAIVFLQTFLKLFPRCRPVVIAPRGMLLTWEEEFRKCKVSVPFHIFNEMKRSPKGHRAAINGAAELYVQGGRANTKNVDRLVRLHSWATRGDGVLGISYGLFQRLASKGSAGATEEAKQKLSRILLEQPGLLIFDEGHTARNERSSIWNVLQKVKTRCRVILSGTPFQNNLRELENVLCLVRPELSGKVSSRAPKTQQRAEPLTYDEIEEVRSLIRPYVHLHRGNILDNLPGLRHCLIFLNPPILQRGLLQTFQSFPRRNYMNYEFKANLASLHPSLLASVATLSTEEESVIGQNLLKALRDEKVKTNPREGAKTMFLMELVRLCASLGEKVLVFSQYREPLLSIREQLLRALGWDEGRVLLMHGGLSPRDRQSCIDAFNAPAGVEVQVLLASIKACCEGISLVGASRVVLLDTVWNPSVERQAISRAYRIGQRRVVFTYHLIAAETGEVERYRRQLKKDSMAGLVLPRCGDDGGPSRVHEDRVLKEMTEHEKLKGMFRRVVDNPREAMLLSDAFDRIPG
ncbi:hypothetical protein Taro_004225 [Colocasia esculenta]|uniref:SNF2 domain-containing protein CLASSY 3 n=1 Tax=Colocasia esculenta TaxID=4460 RepID=A0A843TLE5_COLES|nr:hypothetical protein [Colocasia esculenta]